MSEISSLIVEPSKVGTNLAETYLNKNKNFADWPASEMLWVVYSYPNKIIEHKCQDYDCLIRKAYSPPDKPRYLGIQLSKLIEQNEELFCQLENILRGTAVEDVKNSIILMTQHIQCSNALWASEYINNNVTIQMNENTPLHNLGCVAAALYIKDVRAEVVVTSKTVAPLCHLFVKLCSQVGWEIPLVFVHNTEAYNLAYHSLAGPVQVKDQNCTAVVTEQADVDSALDSMIYASATAPWRLHRVFVQESVYQEFKRGLAWKGERANTDFCADAFRARGKTFLCDQFKFRNKNSGSEVSIEAYRTVKELFGLMKQQCTLFLSIWAESSELSFEIAQGSPCNFIWINEYAAFYGPPLSCLPIYEQIYTESKSTVSAEILNIPTHKTWLQYKAEDRRNIMIKALHNLESYDSDVSELHDAISSRSSFVHVDDGKLCFGLARPAVNENVIYIRHVLNKRDVIKIVSFCLNGYMAVYDLGKCDDMILEVLKSLEADGVPLKLQHNAGSETKEIVVPIFNRLKVVRTQFGTVFAN